MKRLSREEWMDAIATFIDDKVSDLLRRLQPTEGADLKLAEQQERHSACMDALLRCAIAWGRRVGLTDEEVEAAWRRAQGGPPATP